MVRETRQHDKSRPPKFHFLVEQKKLVRRYAKQQCLSPNWSKHLVNVQSRRGVALSEVSISDWTQDELDALYRHWKLACPSVEELRERWRQGRSEKMETDRKVEEAVSNIDKVIDQLSSMLRYTRGLLQPQVTTTHHQQHHHQQQAMMGLPLGGVRSHATADSLLSSEAKHLIAPLPSSCAYTTSSSSSSSSVPAMSYSRSQPGGGLSHAATLLPTCPIDDHAPLLDVDAHLRRIPGEHDGLAGYSPATTDPCRTTIIMNTSFQPLSQHQHQPHHQHQLQEQQQQQQSSHPPPQQQQQQQQQQLQQQQQQQALRWAFPPHLAASSDYTSVVGTGGAITVTNGAYGPPSATADALLATSSSTQPAPSYASQAPRGMPRPTRHDVGPWSQEVLATVEPSYVPQQASRVLSVGDRGLLNEAAKVASLTAWSQQPGGAPSGSYGSQGASALAPQLPTVPPLSSSAHGSALDAAIEIERLREGLRYMERVIQTSTDLLHRVKGSMLTPPPSPLSNTSDY